MDAAVSSFCFNSLILIRRFSLLCIPFTYVFLLELFIFSKILLWANINASLLYESYWDMFWDRPCKWINVSNFVKTLKNYWLINWLFCLHWNIYCCIPLLNLLSIFFIFSIILFSLFFALKIELCMSFS